jgi:hypothetical protein
LQQNDYSSAPPVSVSFKNKPTTKSSRKRRASADSANAHGFLSRSQLKAARTKTDPLRNFDCLNAAVE